MKEAECFVSHSAVSLTYHLLLLWKEASRGKTDDDGQIENCCFLQQTTSERIGIK